MEKIRKYFDRYFKMSDEDWNIFMSKLKKETFDKKCVILKIGQVEKHLSFIESGIVRTYIPGIENDQIFWIAFQNEFVSAYDSFLTQSPCQYQVETITKTVLHRINYQDLQDVYRKTEAGNEIGRRNAENLFLMKCQREMSLLCKTAEQRYLDLFSSRPELIKQIPLKYIASYIGITPQALSRIRRRIS